MPDLGRNDQLVLTALTKSRRPMSAYEILDSTRSKALKAPVQVYRALQKLAYLGLVHRVEALNAYVACSDDHDGLHKPAFVICRDCGAAREFADARIANVAKKAAGTGFVIEQISLEIYGHCADCAPAG